MKKNFLFAAVALCATLFSSCSQDEVVSQSENNNRFVTVSAQLPESYTNTRALADMPNHQLRFILEVQKTDGSLVSSEHRIVKTQASTSANVQFTFNKPEENDCRCVVWADYVDSSSETDKYYNTASLNAISLTAGNTVYNNPAVDAFCGSKLIGSTETLSITLKRPFAKYTLKDSNAALLAQVTALDITATVPDGFNIATGAVSSTKAVTFAGTAAASATELLYGYYFINATTANNPLPALAVTFTVGGNTGSANLTPAESSANSNYSYLSTKDILSNTGTTTDITLDVTIDSDYTDPNAPVAPQVGDYLFADGTWAADASLGTPVAVVFAVGAGAGDDVSNYGGLTKINGYAVALSDATTTALAWCQAAKAALVDISDVQTDYLGYKNTAALSASVNEKGFDKDGNEITLVYAAANSVNSYATAAPTSSSGWYMPSAQQLVDIYTAGLSNVGYTAPEVGAYQYWSSTVNKTNDATINLQACLVSFADGTVIVDKANIKTNRLVRAVVTF